VVSNKILAQRNLGIIYSLSSDFLPVTSSFYLLVIYTCGAIMSIVMLDVQISIENADIDSLGNM